MFDCNKLWPKVKGLEEAQAAGGSGHITATKECIYPATALNFVLDADVSTAPVFILENPLDVASGDAITVQWDGTLYKCTAYPFESMEVVCAFGRLSIWQPGSAPDEMNPPNGNYPFLYVDIGEGMYAFFAETEGEHTISVYKQAETIHPIDPKFLPSSIGGSGAFVFDCSAYGIPVDTQTGELTSGTYTITAEQSKAIVNAIGNAIPIMIADKVPNASIVYPCLMGAIQGGITYLMVGLFSDPKVAMIYETSIVVSAMQ